MFFLKFTERVNKVLQIVLTAIFITMTLSTFLGVLVRFVFRALDIQVTFPWTEELSRYLMIWLVFIGASLAARTDQLISVEVLVHTLPRFIGIAIKLFSLLITFVFFVYLTLIGYELAFNQGFNQTSPILGIPMMIVFLSMFLGSILGMLNLIALYLESVFLKKDIRFTSMEEDSVE
ncbi:TRAP transporter small permease [Alkalihalobacillus oceani]|uniref:TRAP transporter small permease n=1 Tax=Halalkalibacter oceani TaxID=1653776 RepID=A0A9X2INX1_9BACI|nr:TRAP transporter small permease [Halalkalibacter oceani]MCM3712988.1 TRAP transporter small permease [Halalkalibacter oceani]